jgi:iron complex transport system substrate-binding protein
MRIASLLPSATEILFAIGAGDDVVAVTFECDFPAAALSRPAVVGTRLPAGLRPAEIDRIVSAAGGEGRSLYFADFAQLEALAPDVVVLQDLCHVCALDSPTLARDLSLLPSRPVVLSLSGHSLEGVFGDIERLGACTGRRDESLALTAALRARVGQLAAQPHASRRPRVLCLEWLHPLFQGGHWVPEMVALAGGEPVLATAAEKSVRITWEQVAEADPEIVVMMPCGYDLAATVAQFREMEPEFPTPWRELSAVREGRVFAVAGNSYFSRPGPRLVDGLAILDAVVNARGLDGLPVGSVEVVMCSEHRPQGLKPV